MDRLTDADGFRWYGEIGGEGKLSVTTIIENGSPTPLKLKQYFIRNSEKKQAETLKKAGDFGTSFHDLAENSFNGADMPVPEAFKEHVQEFNQWKINDRVKPLFLEKKVVSEKYGFMGTTDFIGYIKDCLEVSDYKTSDVYKKEPWAQQVGAYLLAAIEMGLVPEDCGMSILQIKKSTAQVKHFKYVQIQSCQDAFLRSLDQIKFYYWSKLKSLNWKYLDERALVRL